MRAIVNHDCIIAGVERRAGEIVDLAPEVSNLAISRGVAVEVPDGYEHPAEPPAAKPAPAKPAPAAPE